MILKMNKPVDNPQSTVHSLKSSVSKKQYFKLLISQWLLIIISCTLITGCKIYSFTGTTLSSDLKLKPNDADLLLESTIVGYELTPVSATSGDKAALNRLTIRVEVRFVNSKKEEENFEKEFSFYQDFPQEQTLAQVEGSLVPKIIDQLVLNIFTDTAAQW